MKVLEFVIWVLVTIIIGIVIIYGYLYYDKIQDTNTKVTSNYNWIESIKLEGFTIECE